MRRSAKLLVAGVAALLLVVLSGCVFGPSEEETEDAYRSAIENVEGVDHADVKYTDNGISGNSTSIAVYTTANDKSELTETLHKSIQAYLDEVGEDENSSVNFIAVSADKQTTLGLNGLGYSGLLRILRDTYKPFQKGPEAD